MRKRKVEIARYRGRRGVGKERLQWVLAGLLALAGVVLIAVRAWGMRFSGFLLVGLAALLVLARLLDRWAERSEKGLWCRRAFQTALALVLVPLLIIEAYVIHVGRSDRSALPADAVIVLGAGVNGTEPSLSLRTRLDAALDYDKDKRKGKYNPFLAMDTGKDWQRWEEYLVLAMGRCTDSFERLPLVQDKAILDNILYSGIWMNYRRKRKEEDQPHD